jgi:hypothetical protein
LGHTQLTSLMSQNLKVRAVFVQAVTSSSRAIPEFDQRS